MRAASADPGVFHLWWLGQSGFLVKWGTHHLLLDPYLSDSLTMKYAGSDKPHVRMTARAVAPERLAFVEAVTASHLHTDHLDAETLGPLLKANPRIVPVIPEAIRAAAAERLGIDTRHLRGLADGEKELAGAFLITAVPAAHNELERDEAGRHKFLGYCVRFGNWTVYHAGDTLRYRGQAETLRPHRVDVALLPVNGNLPERRVAGNLDGPQAARLAKDIGAGVAIPMHYEMFAFNTSSPEPFAAECRRLDQPHRVLRCGERWSSTEVPLSGQTGPQLRGVEGRA